MEADGDRVITDIQMLRDLGIVEARPISETQDLLIGLAEGPTSVKQPLDSFLLDDPLFVRRNVGYEVRDSVKRHVQRAATL